MLVSFLFSFPKLQIVFLVYLGLFDKFLELCLPLLNLDKLLIHSQLTGDEFAGYRLLYLFHLESNNFLFGYTFLNCYSKRIRLWFSYLNHAWGFDIAFNLQLRLHLVVDFYYVVQNTTITFIFHEFLLEPMQDLPTSFSKLLSLLTLQGATNR